MANIIPFFQEYTLAKSQPNGEIIIPLRLTAGTGVNTPSIVGLDKPKMLMEGGTGSALTTITQPNIDALLGSTNEVLATTAFGTTAMVDNDTYAFVLDCGGQIAEVLGCQAMVSIAGAGGATLGAGTNTALTNAAFTGIQVFKTAQGNLAGRVNYTNVSAASTAGFLFLRIGVKTK